MLTSEDNKQHKETLNKHKLHILRRMASYASFNKKNEVPLSILKDNINDYNNAQKLRYHALIFKVERGTWGITQHAVKFLKGELSLPEWVLIENNHIIERSDESIDIADIQDDDLTVNTAFEYYKNGIFLGIRPE